MTATPPSSPLRLPNRPVSSPTLPPRPQPDDHSRFAEAVLGSALGALAGGALGGLLIGAAEEDDRRPFQNDEIDPESLAFLLIAGGPPTGAVLYTNIRRDHPGPYVMAVIGELVLGGGGAALGATLGGDSENGQLVGALTLGIPGVIIGAAGGAVLGAPDRSNTRGAVRYADGKWSIGPPTVQVGIHRQPKPGLHGTVSLVNVTL